MKKTNNYVLYILMRTDIPSLTPGRGAAMASHAANAFIHEWGYGNLDRRDVYEWQSQTKQGFGTAIVLSASKPQIEKILRSRVIPQGWIIDPDYVVSVSAELQRFIKGKGIKTEISESDFNKLLVHRSEKTCAYIFGLKEDLEPLVGHLPLYP